MRRLTIETKAMEHTFKVGITFESVDKIRITSIVFFESKIWKIFPVSTSLLMKSKFGLTRFFRVFVMLQTLPTSFYKSS